MQTAIRIDERSDSGAAKILIPVIFAVFGLLLVQFWHRTWDDSAITLGFSRNLVKYGDILPSQYSDRVEGYSTFLWMIINAFFFWLGFTEDQVLQTAKSLSTLLAIVNIGILHRLAVEKIKQPIYQILILALYAVNATTVGSAVFGMETALYAALVLVSYVMYGRRERSPADYAAFSFVASLLILVRHEGALFLAPFVLVALRNGPKSFLKEPFIQYWTLVFIVYHLWHFLYFGEILTNPMMAKSQWPYRPDLTSPADVLNYYLEPFAELISHYILGLVLVVTGLLGFGHRLVDIGRDADWDLIAWIGLIGLFIMLLTGFRWGAAQRLSYPALPFLLLLLFRPIDGIPPRLLIRASILARVSALIGLVITGVFVLRSFQTKEFNVTVEQVHKGARLVTLTQDFLKRDVITYATPDMGGLMLYEGDRKRIIDLGLLCNARLGKYGYAELEQYLFQEERPEIIQAHEGWLLPLEASGSFFEMYIPVRILAEESELFLFIRRDVMADLEHAQAARMIAYRSGTIVEVELNRVLVKFGMYAEINLEKLQVQDFG